MKRVLVALALLASIAYSGRIAWEWIRRGVDPAPRPIDLFAEELRAAIPPTARVRIAASRWNGDANLLSTQLHPRIVVCEGPADWIVEIPDDTFDRAKASYRKAEP